MRYARFAALALVAATTLVALFPKVAIVVTGTPPVRIEGGTASLYGVVYAREHLACDGVTDDRADFKALVEVGGACAGKTCWFDTGCTMLWSACTTGSGDCTVATVAPGTRLLAEPGATPVVKLAARVCVGGNTPGAACPNGAGDCNGGTCSYDTGSHAFAHTTAATYTLLAGPNNAACTALGAPWSCCQGSGFGVCDEIPQGVVVEGFRFDLRQVEDYARCTNGSTEQGLACKGYCAVNDGFLGFPCDQTGTADCLTGGTCVNQALCPGATGVASECDGAALAPAGDGAINVIDMGTTAGVTVRNVIVLDQLKGKGVRVGPGSVVENAQLTASATSFGSAPTAPLPTFAVTHGIEAARGSTVKNSRVRATTTGIYVSNALGRAADAQGITEVAGNTVTAAGTSCAGISVDAAQATVGKNNVSATGTGCTGILLNGSAGRVSRNQVAVSGDYTWAVRGTSNSPDSTYDGNTISVGASANKEGVGMEIAGAFSTATGNTVDGTQTTNSVAYRSNTMACDNWPDCGQGGSVSFAGNNYDMDGNSNGVELFGFASSWSGGGGTLGTGQHISFGQQQQHAVEGGVYQGGNIGAGPTVKSVCDGGANDGRICASGGDCPSGTCDAASGIINWTMTDAVFYLVANVGVYCPTGCHVHDVRATWFSGANSCGIMLGDARGGAGGSVHTVISGATLHRGQSDFTGICHAGGEVKNNVISDIVCLAGTCVDLATNVSGTSDIVNNTIDSVTCASTVGTCFAFPLLNQNRLSENEIGNVASAATAAFSNWTPAQARRQVDGTFVGSATALGTGATCYMGANTPTTACPASSAVMPWTASVAGVLGRMRCTVDTAPGTSNSRTFDLQINGVDASGHGCVISGTATSCVIETVSSAVAAGDLVRVEVTRSGAVASGATCVVDFHRNP